MPTRSSIPLALVLVLSAATCSRPRASPPDTATVDSAIPAVEVIVAESLAKIAESPKPVDTQKVVRYCDVYPEHCRPCPTGPGTCGGSPLAGACCCQGGGCVAVGFASDCDPACDFLPCEWGYQTEDDVGSPEVWCYD